MKRWLDLSSARISVDDDDDDDVLQLYDRTSVGRNSGRVRFLFQVGVLLVCC